MAEEIVTKFRCDRCNHIEEVVMTSGFFGIVFKKPAPPGWGSDKSSKLMLCATCFTEYQQKYTAWFNAWMNSESNAIEVRSLNKW